MKRMDYLIQVQVTENATELHALTRIAATDPQLSPADYIEIRGEVGKKFSALNAAAIGQPKPRW
jgi:hypothetical protein